MKKDNRPDEALYAAHRAGEVLRESAGESGMHIRGRFDDATLSRFREFVVT